MVVCQVVTACRGPFSRQLQHHFRSRQAVFLRPRSLVGHPRRSLATFSPAIVNRLAMVQTRYNELEAELNALHVGSGKQPTPQQLAKLNREHSELSELVQLLHQLEEKQKEEKDLQSLSKDPDPEIANMAKEELGKVQEGLESLHAEVLRCLLPRDEGGDRGVVLEVRAGTGGDEAALFTAEIFIMYQKYASLRGWRFEVLTESKSDLGGYKEASAAIQGDQVYQRLKHESGVHRVQRVPVNDTRLHTSAATVAVLPEPEEVDLRLDPRDLKYDVFRASGAGGQHVNTTESAVRVTHIPTGIVVAIQDERSQHKNKDKALKILRARIFEKEQERVRQEQASERSRQVGSGDRSERIRTYNYAQDRVTDHRVNLTKYGIERMLSGEMVEEYTRALLQAEETEKLKQLLEGGS
uniref:Mitochondrial peptide chain release factor 1 n=1 Tax=Trachydiscus minutus TaxID=1032745 RepID=A0A140ECJ8_9STRA|nr:mitochondrial peptide chain release factor 1 [Trachydiscus minutus]